MTYEANQDDFSKKDQEYQEIIQEFKLKLEEAEQKLAANIGLPPDSPNVSLLDPSLVSDLREELELSKETISFLKEDNTRMKNENEELTHLSTCLRLEIQELKSSMAEKDEEVASYRDSVRQAQEELKILSMEDDEEIHCEVAPKGNSLFSEVEDRRHIAEQQLKKSQAREQKYKALYERQVLELNRVRMQNVHLMNLTSNGHASGKFSQAFVERLQSQLNSEKDKNKDLTAKLDNDVEMTDFVKTLMRQSTYDGEKMRELSKQLNDVEKQVSKLKADNFSLKMRLNEGKKASPQTENKENKDDEFIFENIVFEKKKSPEKNKLMADLDGFLLETERKNNEEQPLKEVQIKSKKVMFQVSQTLEDDQQKPKMKSSRKIPKLQSEHKILDADEECAKMEEQCKQQ